MKFNLYDDTTWKPAVAESLEKAVVDRVNSEIGAILKPLRVLRESILRTNSADSEAEIIATELENTNKEAFDIMGVSFVLPDIELVNSVKQDIDFVFSIWDNKDARTVRWREILPVLQKLEPYTQERRNEVCQSFVRGNAAWVLYLKTEKERKYHKKRASNYY